jgi:hypothetical protein
MENFDKREIAVPVVMLVPVMLVVFVLIIV